MAVPRELISTWLISSIAINDSKQLRYNSCTSELHNKNPYDRFTQYTFAARCSAEERGDLKGPGCRGSGCGGGARGVQQITEVLSTFPCNPSAAPAPTGPANAAACCLPPAACCLLPAALYGTRGFSRYGGEHPQHVPWVQLAP